MVGAEEWEEGPGASDRKGGLFGMPSRTGDGWLWAGSNASNTSLWPSYPVQRKGGFPREEIALGTFGDDGQVLFSEGTDENPIITPILCTNPCLSREDALVHKGLKPIGLGKPEDDKIRKSFDGIHGAQTPYCDEDVPFVVKRLLSKGRERWKASW